MHIQAFVVLMKKTFRRERATESDGLPELMVRSIVLAITLAGLAAASVWSILAGLADYWARQFTVTGTERALALTPWQAAYYVQLALLIADDDPQVASDAIATRRRH